MIKPNILYYTYASIVLVITINLYLSKPITSLMISTTTPNGIISSGDSVYRSSYATRMLSFMNLSVNPCNDFYEYACGNWKHVMEERMSIKKRNNILDIAYKLDDIAENILQRNHINDVAPEYAAEFEVAKKFYNNCMLAEVHPLRVSSKYLAVLKEIGGFPAVDVDWNSRDFHWLRMSAHLSNYGIKTFIKESITSQYPFSPYYQMPDFGFDTNLDYNTIQNSSSNAYKENEKHMRHILSIYGVKSNHLDRIIIEIFDMLSEILKVMQRFNKSEAKCKFLSKIVTDTDIPELKEKWRLYHDIAWLSKPFESVITPCFYLYAKLDKICEKNKRAAANYLALKFLFHMDARLKDRKFQKAYCIANIKSSMMYLFDHLYMKMYFSDELRKEICDMIKEIRQNLRTIIKEATWLDEPTRKAALLKESTIVEHIGRYENTNVTKLLIDELKRLQFVDDSYETNNLNLRKFQQYMKRFNGLNFEKLSNTTKPPGLLYGMQVNSFYSNIDNSIYVLAGLLMEPVYNKAWPKSLKYGTLGYVLGHELTHGFDTMGANYDEKGQSNYWWSTKSGELFKERTRCYVDHYKSYVIPEINRNINGIRTKDENIADGGGLREALMAYRSYIKNVTKDFDSLSAIYKEEQMPGINLSPEQLFFLGFAQLWCASYKEADYWKELTTEHVVDKYRVLGALSNSDDFAKVYNCSVGTKMNPMSNKCELW